MSTIINNVLDLFTKKPHKLPQAMIILFIFAAAFPGKAEKVVDIIITKAQILLPESITALLTDLMLSQTEFLTLWAFLLIIFAITLILCVLRQLLDGYTYLILNSACDILLAINSVIFLSVLIYNTLYAPGVIISFGGLSIAAYPFCIFLSAGLFFIAFIGTYCTCFLLILRKIIDSDISTKLRILLLIIYLIFSTQILAMIFNLLFY